MRTILGAIFIQLAASVYAQVPVDLKAFRKENGTRAVVNQRSLFIEWPTSKSGKATVTINLTPGQPLLESIGAIENGLPVTIVRDIDPVFLLTTGTRDLVSQNGWNIFFDKVPLKPHTSARLELKKKAITVRTSGSRTVVAIDSISGGQFAGIVEITLYNGSPLLNVAAVVSTERDSTAILYDAGLAGKQNIWDSVGWSSTADRWESTPSKKTDSTETEAVKYRTIVGQNKAGCVAVFPAPHQYFYPLDEAFNLRFTWHGSNYRKLIPEYGIGIRQDLFGDKRFVPWFNAPPGTKQRLNFFCLVHPGPGKEALERVKRFTHDDTYLPLKGYKTMASHFHNEFVMSVVLAGKAVPEIPSFVQVFKAMGIDIVHLAEFHYTAHPKGPDQQRLEELHALFQQCERLSDDRLLLLPGEEPNEFFGGHWLQLFPKPVYWIMSRKEGQPFVTQDPKYGTVYRIGDAGEMLKMLEGVNGLVWTAHPRTKGSTGYPDRYRNEAFFKSSHFLGAAWKAMPADLSVPWLGKRVLDLADDMNNWHVGKRILAEADLFTIEPENEMYAHLNVNYLALEKLPAYAGGWEPVLTALQKGRYFSSTGEVLIPAFTVNGTPAGDTARLVKGSDASLSFHVSWTFPLSRAEIVSGDGTGVFRQTINLDATLPFREQTFSAKVPLGDRQWVRLEVWDAAANGAFTQTVWLSE